MICPSVSTTARGHSGCPGSRGGSGPSGQTGLGAQPAAGPDTGRGNILLFTYTVQYRCTGLGYMWAGNAEVKWAF